MRRGEGESSAGVDPAEMYDVEDRAADMTAAERQALRQRESVPILDRIEKISG